MLYVLYSFFIFGHCTALHQLVWGIFSRQLIRINFPHNFPRIISARRNADMTTQTLHLSVGVKKKKKHIPFIVSVYIYYPLFFFFFSLGEANKLK